MSVLLSIGSSTGRTHLRGSSAGRTHLRGGSAASAQTEETRANHSGKRLRGGGGGGRKLQASPAAGGDSPPAVPECHTLLVPAKAEALEGSYTFNGRFNKGHPVYKDAETGNTIFYDSSHFYITQPSHASNFFLSLESDVYEPADLEGLNPWERNNDPTCKGCHTSIRISCTTLTADAASPTPGPTTAVPAAAQTTPTPAPTPEPTPEPTAPPAVVAVANVPSPTPAPTTAATLSSITGSCMNLDIQGGGRTGAYGLDTDATGQALLKFNRPTYTAVGVGVNATANQVFTVMMDVCAAGYGAVDAEWADTVVQLTPTATVQAVFLMYVARHGDNGGLVGSTGSCEAPVWLLTSGDVVDLETAGEDTFLSVSDVEDPSEATSWAKFTPATATSRATLVENLWIDVACGTEAEADADAYADAGAGAASSGAGAGESTGPVGTEPNARRLRGGRS